MVRSLLVSAAALALSCVCWGQVDVLTANYDNNRTSANLGEFVLNKSNVNPNQFGKLYTLAVDGEVYAQPLYVRGVALPGGTKNVVFVVTMNNSVYAYDADSATSTAPVWKRNFGIAVDPRDFDYPLNSPTNPPIPGEPYTDILTQVGILGTPVIDKTTNTLYVVHYTFTGELFKKTYTYYLHALDLITGADKFGGPVAIEGTSAGTGWIGQDVPVNGEVSFNGRQHIQRPGLLLLNGTVYVAFGSHGDQGPWHGWIMAYDAATLKQTSVFNATPNNAGGASIWQSGRGLAADSAGNVYFVTGNGTWDGRSAWGESVVKLTESGGLKFTDYFTPAEWSPLNGGDTDLGSSGAVLIPNTNLLYTIGKEGVLWLLDQTNLGHEATLNSQIVQSFQAAEPGITLEQSESGFRVFNTALWDNAGGAIFYMWPNKQPVMSYRMHNGTFQMPAYSMNATATNRLPFSGMTISANGSQADSGILWITSLKTSPLPAPGTLHAFDALDLSVELWNSDMQSARDAMGNFVKFANPTVANGKVFLPTNSRAIAVYGLLPNVAGIASVVNSASFANGVVSPGELVTIFGNSVGAATPVSASVDPVSQQIPIVLGDMQVTFDGTPAALLYTSSGQINAVVPFAVAGQQTSQLVIKSAGGQLNRTVQVGAANPAIFSANSSGAGQGAILNVPSLSKNSDANPAPLGSEVAIYATGTGVTKPASKDGVLTGTNPPLVAQPVTVTIGGQTAQVLYQGAAPGFVAGLTQINVTIPSNITPGPEVPVTIAVGGATSVSGITLAVK